MAVPEDWASRLQAKCPQPRSRGDHGTDQIRRPRRAPLPPEEAALARIDGEIASGTIAGWATFGGRDAVVARLAVCRECPEETPRGCGRTPHTCKQAELMRQAVLLGSCPRFTADR